MQWDFVMRVEMPIKQEFIKRKYSTTIVRLYKLEKPCFEGISIRNRDFIPSGHEIGFYCIFWV
jgi:hypothetical protein